MAQVSALFFEAANIMLMGMVVVFIFLGMLVFAIKLLHRLSLSLSSSVVSTPLTPLTPTIKSNETSVVTPEIVSAITAAVHQYRQDKNN
ncbi:OadG family transporter subunit [Flocculibacter collagenilyticus]|uniref:OadG family transporter subunit n=1 Tax=Flocculibacter collagenilyticus TaxID=2744479 RepID=UPI0018F7512D|nr:OadG family transporter subunit [Flocculibacter collagenilyticus]